ncbi:MAG: nucleotidyl transferase AbiEii/AbiGii toxin family protein [Steroidobacteraceae bacterium]
MASAADFEALVERAMRAGQRAHMRPAIEKELLHYDILFALDQSGLLDQLTFRGGTALRLCYGSQRFSEDLDFVGGSDFASGQLHGLKSCIVEYVGKRHGLEVRVKEPQELAQEPENRQVNVYKWQIRVTTAPERRDLPRQMIKIEVAAIPAYSRVARALHHNYDFLPDGYGDLIILAESLDEILADKLVSLPACTAYVRHRDIWDLHWLRQQGARPNTEMIRHKIQDYGVTNYAALVASVLDRLPGIIRGKEFRDQMSRFLPQDVPDWTLLKDKFLELLERETAQALQSAAEHLGPSK